MPSREELTIAWGDTILPGLRPGVKVYLSAGRFVGVDDAADLRPARQGPAVAGRAQPGRGRGGPGGAFRAAGATPAGAGRARRPGGPAASRPRREDPSEVDLDDLEDAPAALLSPEQRLLEAFPGAEEVSP